MERPKTCCGRRECGTAKLAEPHTGCAERTRLRGAGACRRLPRLARILLFLLAAGFAAQPGRGSAQTAPVLPLAVPSSPTPAATTDTTNPAELDTVLQRPLFGDLPVRQALAARGITFSAHYISETMSNTRGVKGTSTDYAQQVDFGFAFDLGKLGVLPDAIATFAMTDRAGRSLAADRTGSYFAYQEIFGQGQNFRFNQITLEKFLLDKNLSLKAGFYPMGNDFATLPYVCNFTNVAFCGHPQSLPVDSGWSDAPAGRWGGRVKYRITDALDLQTGVFDVNPLMTLKQNGFKLDLHGSTGMIVPVEIGYQLGRNPADYGGTYKIGAYYDSSAAADLANPAEFDQGREGLYLEAAQQIYKWGPGLRNGLALFGILTVSDQNTAKFKRYYEAGASSRGVFPSRPLDILSLGWVRADINPRFQFHLAEAGLPIQTNEQLIELNYGVQVTPSLLFRPGVQYDIRPGATSAHHPNTWVFGFHIQLTL